MVNPHLEDSAKVKRNEDLRELALKWLQNHESSAPLPKLKWLKNHFGLRENKGKGQPSATHDYEQNTPPENKTFLPLFLWRKLVRQLAKF